MKPTITPMKTYTVEGLSNKHCVLLYALLASYRMGSSTDYGYCALELIEMIETLDLDIDNDLELVVINEDGYGDNKGPETRDFVLELK